MEKILCPRCSGEMEPDGQFWECEDCNVSGPMTKEERDEYVKEHSD